MSMMMLKAPTAVATSSASGSRARPRCVGAFPQQRRRLACSSVAVSAAAASSDPPSSSPSPTSSSSSTAATVIAPPPPLQSAASVSTAPPPSPGDPEVFPPPGLPAELLHEWEKAVAAVEALLERAAADSAAAAASASPSSSSGPPRRRRAGGREEPDAPPDVAARRHVARAFGWGSQTYWRHAVVCAAPDARRVERALAFLTANDDASDDGLCAPLGLSAVEAAGVLKTFPEMLFLDADARLGANAAQLRGQWRLTEPSALRGAVTRHPRALGYDVDCQGSCVGDCHRCWARF